MLMLVLRQGSKIVVIDRLDHLLIWSLDWHALGILGTTALVLLLALRVNNLP